MNDEPTRCNRLAQRLGPSRQDSRARRGFLPHGGRPPAAPRRDRRAQALPRTVFRFDVRLLPWGAEVLRGCHLQPHPGGTRSATDSRDHRRNALRKGAPGRVAPARAAPHCRKSSRGARTGGGQVEARDRGAGRPTVTAAARCAIGAETSCASPSSRAARSGFESSRKASVETRRPSSKRRATWRRHVQGSVHGGPTLSGEAPPRPGSIPAPDSGRGPDVHFRQGTRRPHRAGRKGRDSRPAANPVRTRFRRRTRLLRATFRMASSAPSTSATARAAHSQMRRGEGAPRPAGWNSTIWMVSPARGCITSTASGYSAVRTISTRPSRPMAAHSWNEPAPRLVPGQVPRAGSCEQAHRGGSGTPRCRGGQLQCLRDLPRLGLDELRVARAHAEQVLLDRALLLQLLVGEEV